jgi:hypothetical protein
MEPGLGRVSQVNGQELDEEEVIIHPVRPTCKAGVLHPNVGVGFAVILDNVVRCPKHLGKHVPRTLLLNIWALALRG